MYQKIAADLHTHTLASGHAYGTIREMAHAAAQKGLLLLGISDHAPGIPGTADPIYFAGLSSAVPHLLYGVEMLYGCEINVLTGGKLSLEQKIIDKLDYALAGLHTLCYSDEGRKKNTENLIECMKNDKVCFVSHPDDDHTPLDYTELVPAAKTYHAALEVNNSSFLKIDKRWNCLENYRAMLRLCMEQGVFILVSSDAHDPGQVGRFDEAMQFLNEQHFDERLILNNDPEKIKRFIAGAIR